MAGLVAVRVLSDEPGDVVLLASRRLRGGGEQRIEPLRQFLQTSDDRRRAIENDPRAKATAPPAPAPTAIPGEGGFTAFEAIWNYFFWQTLSINMLDEDAHILRAGLTAPKHHAWARPLKPSCNG